MTTPAYVPYWPSFVPGPTSDPFTSWFLTANNGAGSETAITDFANAGNEIDNPEGDLHGLWAGPYLNPLPGTLDTGLIPYYPTPQVWNYNGRFAVDLGVMNAYGFLAIPDSSVGFGNGIVRPLAGSPAVAPFARTKYRQVQNVGLVVETDVFGNTGVMLNCSGQCTIMVHRGAPAVGSSPDIIPSGLSVQIKFGGTVLWTLPITNVVMDSVNPVLEVDVTQTITTDTYTDLTNPAYVTGDNPTGIYGQTDDETVSINPLYSYSSYSWSGHVVVPVPGAIVSQIIPAPPLQPVNALPPGFGSIIGVCPSDIYPSHSLPQTPLYDFTAAIQGTGVTGFHAVISPATPSDYNQVNNKWVPPGGHFSGTIPDPIPDVGGPLFPNFIQVDPPAYLFYADHF